MYFIFFIISFLASIVGSICGIGGGIIIKPVLDAFGYFDVSSISFLSGSTVLAMSTVSVMLHLKTDRHVIRLSLSTPLAIGAAFGGILGKYLFQYFYLLLPDNNKIGAIQAFILVLLTLGTLIYTLMSHKIKTHHLQNKLAVSLVGLTLGLLSSFLGIGGGPINLILLEYCFSIKHKEAAVNSLYIIMISQFTSLISTILSKSLPEFDILIIIIMVFAGITGGMLGSKLHKKISSQNGQRLFIGLMAVIIGISIYNIFRFVC
ncbi:MAG TPA: sulfite exporter TauE/SafE family protein [Clostridiales bacterium]|nr:sulfite exporter TauE/SafE family protein [Clostridiales bacterium]